ncbi:MAG: pyridoxal phosphate-dependent aminotransferase [Acidobacteria bacterium]|nr:pyridoxal phosphate-dependent aminotransferase [Acidobacteriota bacterium]
MPETIQLTDRINRIAASPTLAVLIEAEKYKARGIDVVDFGPGEPDFPTPEHIKRAAIAAIEKNLTKYTPVAGIMPLRETICTWHRAQFGSDYAWPECIVSVGGKQSIFNAVSILVSSGDEVIVPAPYWVSFPDIVKYAGGIPVHAQTSAADGFRLSAAHVEAAITPKTKMVIVNSPNNPTGAVVPENEFVKILDVCRKRGIWLLADECYSHFIYGETKPFSIAGIPDSKSRLIVVGSLSKTFAMTGWRVGYALAPKPIIDAMNKLQSQSTSNPTSIAQYAALAALQGSMDSVRTMLEEYGRRRTRILAGLSAIPGIQCASPDGAFYVFPQISRGPKNGAATDTAALAKRLLEEPNIVCVAGEGFGAPGFLRFSYATSMDRIEEGLRRLTKFFSSMGAAA